MKKALLVLIAAFALSIGAYAQRQPACYIGVGVATNLRSATEGKTGPAVAVGFRNYNRDMFLSFGYGAELFGYYIPSKTKSAFGAFANPEIGLAIGPRIFKVYPHTGFMLGYDSAALNANGEKQGFGWGGKDGIAFDFGRFLTIDFSAYVPKYQFREALYAASIIVRLGR